MKRLSSLISAGLQPLRNLAASISRRMSRLQIDAHRRGRFARTPFAMPWLGWKDIVARTWEQIFNDRLLSVAAGVAFFALLALVPSLSVMLTVFALVADPAQIEVQLAPLVGLMPDTAATLVMDQAHRLAQQAASQPMSLTLIVSLAIALWSANAGIQALFDALNVIYDEDEKRSFLALNALSLAITLGAAVVLIVVVGLVTVLPVVVAKLPFAAAFEGSVALLRWPTFLVLVTAALAVLFWIGPSRRRARFVWVLPGAALAALLWALVSALFNLYVSRLGSYDVAYGSLSAVIVLMTWLWLSATAILIGAELNAELEHQTMRDTTEGPPKPIGARGARRADAIG
ncbi:MAG TPA: YihY/virulence factor BrkB family protein, partial [Beijerinckiaceae bacterium]|nr:YihY/virulence factor BrkB family protein [Beijerinckiaceae bacterium]